MLAISTNTVLLVGGNNATQDICYSADAHVLNPVVLQLRIDQAAQLANSSWQAVAHIPTPRGFACAAAARNSGDNSSRPANATAVLVIGGFDGAHDITLVESLNLSSRQWAACS